METWKIVLISLAVVLVLIAAGIATSIALQNALDKQTEADIQSQLVDKEVDLTRYADGNKWYEIASLPTSFQKDCLCSTAQYDLDVKTQLVSVANRCTLQDDEIKTANAVAWPKNSNKTWLKVNFLPESLVGERGKRARFWPFSLASADYLILHVDDAYTEAVVGSPKKQFLWILSRSQTLTKADYERLVNVAREKGYDVDRLQTTCRAVRVDDDEKQ